MTRSSTQHLHAPLRPRTVFGMANNAGRADRELPPQAFPNAAASVVGAGEPVVLPEGIGLVEAEAELAVVIAAPLWQCDPQRALGGVLGYSVALSCPVVAGERASGSCHV
jgi:2-keto-4-pentenoate hydratase/2-oxohepta-3-ene-1,7-dioic acid hydratase in catechol pathway